MIHFVGAGPGAADLITMRGHQLLTEADVIIYAGSLVNPELLQYAKASCNIYNSASMTLEEVIAVMTLPNVSQSVIITRMAGRTPVPEKEEIALLAAHQATMVIFLSTGMLEQLSQRLLAGGYQTDTPAAIVYKATWDDEKVCHCTIATLAQTAKEHNITKTALIIVGNCLGNEYERSLLYHPSFTHEFRKGTSDL